MKINAQKVPVMESHCKTCPFKPNELGHYQDMCLANEVIQRTLFKAHQICHSTQDEIGNPHNRCKGAYVHNLEIYKRMGLDHLIE
jgi:hypothetical protein